MNQGSGLTHTQAINAIWEVTTSLSRMFGWLVFWICQLLLALACFALLWWFQVTPDQITAVLLGWSQSKTASLLGFAGMSVLGLMAAYLALTKWLWKKLYMPWQVERLMRDL